MTTRKKEQSYEKIKGGYSGSFKGLTNSWSSVPLKRNRRERKGEYTFFRKNTVKGFFLFHGRTAIVFHLVSFLSKLHKTLLEGRTALQKETAVHNFFPFLLSTLLLLLLQEERACHWAD